jgi:hypothetical protein
MGVTRGGFIVKKQDEKDRGRPNIRTCDSVSRALPCSTFLLATRKSEDQPAIFQPLAKRTLDGRAP